MTMMMWLTLCRPPWANASLDPVKERKRRTAHNAALSARCMVILLSRNFLFDFDKGNDCIPISPVPCPSKLWMQRRTDLPVYTRLQMARKVTRRGSVLDARRIAVHP